MQKVGRGSRSRGPVRAKFLPGKVQLYGTYHGSVPYLMIEMYAVGYRGDRVRREPVLGVLPREIAPVYPICGMH